MTNLEAIVKLQRLRHVLQDQLAHVRHKEDMGFNRDYERNHIEGSINAIDLGKRQA
jgi:hypothetical protein